MHVYLNLTFATQNQPELSIFIEFLALLTPHFMILDGLPCLREQFQRLWIDKEVVARTNKEMSLFTKKQILSSHEIYFKITHLHSIESFKAHQNCWNKIWLLYSFITGKDFNTLYTVDISQNDKRAISVTKAICSMKFEETNVILDNPPGLIAFIRFLLLCQ